MGVVIFLKLDVSSKFHFTIFVRYTKLSRPKRESNKNQKILTPLSITVKCECDSKTKLGLGLQQLGHTFV